MGELSYLYKGLANYLDKMRIAAYFDVDYIVLESWMHTLTYVRNICAHHSRLWNRDLGVEPVLLSKPKGDWIDTRFENNKRIFYFLCVLKYLLNRANPGNSLKSKIQNLFEKYPNVPIQYLGIPSDGAGNLLLWENEPIWSNEVV